MKTTMTIQARAFTARIRDERTGEESADIIVLTKEQLQASQLVGQSSTELICRLYNRQGYQVLEIGKPSKREITLNLEELYHAHCLHTMGKREKVRV